MARIGIAHTTTYTYRTAVGLADHRLMVRPRDSHDIWLHGATLRVDPAPHSVRWAHDVFGNSICLLRWPASLRTTRLTIVSSLDLTHYPDCPDLPAPTLYPAAERYPFTYAALEQPDLLRLAQPQWAGPAVAAWARSFLDAGGSADTLDLLARMTRAIQAGFTYGARHEEGTQTPADTLRLGTGTCRDFAVLMMEALRALGIAAKFVTGYLYDDDDGTTRGGGATHAWCSVYLPGAGWVEYDPTNGLIGGTNLVRIAVVREAAQAIPVAGGYLGEPGATESLDVDVTVTAAPRPATGARDPSLVPQQQERHAALPA